VLTGPDAGIANDLQLEEQDVTRQHAAVCIMFLGCCVINWDDSVEAEGRGVPRAACKDEGGIVSDALQKAMLLHSAVFIAANRQQQQQQQQQEAAANNPSSSSSSSSGWAPEEAFVLLEQLGFPLAGVPGYAAAVCRVLPQTDPLIDHMNAGESRLSVLLAGSHPLWAVDSSAAPDERSLALVVAPRMCLLSASW